MQRKYQQRRQSSLHLRKWLSRRFTADFSTIDWGDDDSCESGTSQTGGEEAGRSAIESRQDKSSSDGTKKKNPLRRLSAVFHSFAGSEGDDDNPQTGGEEAGRSAIKSLQDTSSSNGTKKKKNPLERLWSARQCKSSSTPEAPAPPALVHPPTSTLDESEISVDDDGFLRWHHSKRTFVMSE